MPIAVIIPLYNGARWIEDTLRSVRTQTRPPTEIVVVDDGSKDTGPDLVRASPSVTYARNPGKGANFARQHGFELTTSPFVAFLDQDDIWHPEHLATLRGMLDRAETSGAIAPSTRFRDSTMPNLGYAAQPVTLRYWEDFPLNSIGTPSQALFRRSAIDSMGGWPTDYPGVADIFVYQRICANASLASSTHVTVGRRLHVGSYSHALRLGQAATYLRSYLAASTETARVRLEYQPSEHGRIDRRLRLLIDTANLLNAFDRRDGPSVFGQAMAIDRSLGAEPADFSVRFMRLLWWFLAPSLEASYRQEKSFVEDIVHALDKARTARVTPLALCRQLPLPLRFRLTLVSLIKGRCVRPISRSAWARLRGLRSSD